MLATAPALPEASPARPASFPKANHDVKSPQASGGGNRQWQRSAIALIAIAAISLHLILRYLLRIEGRAADIPLLIALVLGGLPLIYELGVGVLKKQFGSDLLAGISIITSVLLDEYLAGTLVVLMLSGGQALEAYAVRSASSVLEALAKRMPSIAHRKIDGTMTDVALADVEIDDAVVVFPHEICPVDGVVLEGHGVMDESYLTGEPFQMSKAPGADVLSGAINGDSALTIRATKIAADSRYANIMRVMRASEQDTPHMRRLGDQLGALYTPTAVLIAIAAWIFSGQADRFLAVLVVATPCPLLIAIPVAIIGSISLSARRGIIVKKPAVLEQVDTCRTLIFDKTGTLTYGEPRLSSTFPGDGVSEQDLLSLTAALERFSKHPLARAVLVAADAGKIVIPEAASISEKPGEGLAGVVEGKQIQITSRKRFATSHPDDRDRLPQIAGGLECIVLIDGRYGGTLQFRDEPRSEGASFVAHLGPQHHVQRLMLVSGDRASEVQYLADRVGIREVHASQSPEEKLAIVRRETAQAHTLYLGDGINDAPALLAANVGVALGQNSDITTEAAGAVIMDSSLKKVDEFLHIGRRMRKIALQSAIGGMALSVVGMGHAAAGYLPPVAGAIAQEIIDVVAVVNALRAAYLPRQLSDF